MVYEPFARPTAQGLYDPAYEHDACGVGFVARLDGVASHDIVEKGLEVLRNLDHRGATGADTAAGDGAGILVQIPDAFLRKVIDAELPAQGSYAVGMAFLPTDESDRQGIKAALTQIAVEEGLRVLAWRCVPTETSTLSHISLEVMPHMEMVIVDSTDGGSGLDLERLAYVLRRRAQHEQKVYFSSLSCRTVVYKGMLTTSQLETVYPELHDPDLASACLLYTSPSP